VSDLPVAEIQATAEERSELRAVQELVARAESGVRLRVGTDEVELPRSLLQGLVAVASSLEDGDTVAIVSEQAELSPAQAARLLGVSRQYVDRLVASGDLSSRRLPKSSYRKVLVRDVLQHKTLRERKRTGINRVVDEATAAGLEY
jgi:excisionase family DNA binding protein